MTARSKPRVERMVQFVRGSFFAGESFIDLADGQRRVETWCMSTAGTRIHGTIQCRPIELFNLPVYAMCKVHRDHHIEIAKALYSVPGDLIGTTVGVRADAKLVKIFARGQLVKIHPRQPPGRRSTDPADLPAAKTAYALRDIEHLKALAARHGDAVGAYATALLDHPLPWTKMRQVYALLSLAKRWGDRRVDNACRRALDAEAINVGLISRMLERATEDRDEPVAIQGQLLPARFARNPTEFASGSRGSVAAPDTDGSGTVSA